MKNILSYITDSFFNLIYNKNCLVCACAKADNYLCKNCAKDVHYLNTFAQRIYKNIGIFCAANYDSTVKKLIHLLKFSHCKNASKPLADILFSYFQRLNLKEEYIIVYPPSFYLKSAYRGYNHMFLIAKEFSKLTNFKIEKELIKKIKYTKPQYKCKNRHANIKGSFEINQKLIEKYKDKNILLIDDITTSGATLEEIINCFLNSNFKNITCLCISKASC